MFKSFYYFQIFKTDVKLVGIKLPGWPPCCILATDSQLTYFELLYQKKTLLMFCILVQGTSIPKMKVIASLLREHCPKKCSEPFSRWLLQEVTQDRQIRT